MKNQICHDITYAIVAASPLGGSFYPLIEGMMFLTLTVNSKEDLKLQLVSSPVLGCVKMALGTTKILYGLHINHIFSRGAIKQKWIKTPSNIITLSHFDILILFCLHCEGSHNSLNSC